MSPNNYQKVYSVNGMLHAVAVQTTLESAGIPAEVNPSKQGNCLDVLVPVGCAGEASRLLYPDRPRGGDLLPVDAKRAVRKPDDRGRDVDEPKNRHLDRR